MSRNAWVIIPEIDNEIQFSSDPTFYPLLSFNEELTYDLINTMVRVFPDPNVVELYKLFLVYPHAKMDTYYETKEHKIQRLLSNLMERYNPGYNDE